LTTHPLQHVASSAQEACRNASWS